MTITSESKVRLWTFTNYDMEFDYEPVMTKAQYVAYGLETCPKTGRLHHQGWMYFKNPQGSIKNVATLLGKAHVEKAKGSLAQNEKYCAKEGNLTELGVKPEQGKRTELDEVRQIVRETSSMREVVEVANSYQSVRMAETLLKYNEKARPYKTREVIWFYGPTGTGKTHTVYAEEEDIFVPLSFKWWDGYDGHKVVLLDDVRPDFCKFHEILMLTGERPFRVECKGGSRQAMYDKIYITAPFHPKDMWQQPGEQKAQLLDRITEIREFTGESMRGETLLNLVTEPAEAESENGTEVLEQKSGVILSPDKKKRKTLLDYL